MREPYNLVDFGDTDPNAHTFIEGLADPVLDLVTGRGSKGPEAEVVEEEIRVYEYPPFLTRFGSAV